MITVNIVFTCPPHLDHALYAHFGGKLVSFKSLRIELYIARWVPQCNSHCTDEAEVISLQYVSLSVCNVSQGRVYHMFITGQNNKVPYCSNWCNIYKHILATRQDLPAPALSCTTQNFTSCCTVQFFNQSHR